MKRFTIFIFSLIYINCLSQQYSKSWKDLNYAGDAMGYHRLDIYLPKVEKPIYPAVILIYGSAWFGNNLKGSDLATLGKALLDTGFAVVTPNHRSSADAKFPAQINDIKAAIRFIRGNAEKYQIDTSFIGITGSSSGGHLAALAGTSGLIKQYTVGSASVDIEGNLGQYTTYCSSVHAVVDWFGPIDLLVIDSCKRSKDANSPESILIGGPVQDNEDKCALANPITYIDANDPPFLILHGDADPLIPHCQSELLFNALQKASVPSQFALVPNAQHGPGLFVEKYFKMMTDFFQKESGITKVDTEDKNTLVKFSVFQNYPNPFNPSTIINYSIPVDEYVSINVYDILGNEVATLVNEDKPAATYTFNFNAEHLASGVYIYQLIAKNFLETKKLILLK
jgi:acetyl esterase/lipase